MLRPVSLRNRLFLTLFLVALIPTAIALVVGTVALREVVVSTGTAGAWNEVAESGRALLDRIEAEDVLSPEGVAAAEEHRARLGESVRLSRVYAFLGERVRGLLPFFAFGLLALAAVLALLAANRISRNLSEPVERLVELTRSLGAGAPLPAPDARPTGPRIGEFVLLEHALRNAATELEGARASELERARMKSWTEMARRVAHDIKNPLTPMAMAADRVARSPDPATAEAGQVLQEEIGRLDALARSFAQFGRPPEGPLSPVDLRELLEGLARRLSTPELPIRVELPEEAVTVEAYLEPLERAVRNLVANAQEAGAPVSESGSAPTPVELRLEAGDGSVRIRVLDRGPGIPPDLLPRIWEPEFTTKRRGTGLGLSMVRQVVDGHGGSVGASNREGGGAEFTVHLPVRAAGASPPSEDPKEPSQ